ncbi:MAG: chromate transporter [Candidatus Rokuibacteriota bacterium]|nr:MAG: chromate transporter [Candidatus Rokubacteria bacterium]
MSPLVTIATRFMVLSLVAVGGVQSILPEVHRVVVDVHHWVTDAEFTQMFVIARAAPGPNMLLVTLIGWHVAGLPGAVVATAAVCLPSCTLSYFAAHAWQRFRGAPWRRAVEVGLAPITVGLVLATGWLVMRGAPGGWVAYTITAVTTVVVLFTRINPVWLFAAAGALGLLGVV